MPYFYAILTLLFILLLFYPIDATFIYNNSPTLVISLPVFRITLKNFKRKRKIHGIKNRLSLFLGYTKSSLYLIRHSKIHVSALYVGEGEDFFKNALLSHAAPSVAIPFFVSLLESNAKKFTVSKDAFVPRGPHTTETFIELSVSTALIYTLISFFLVIFTAFIKENLKLGKQNE